MEKYERFARTILNGFESYFAEFQNITLAAKSRFENADWQGMHRTSTQRIDLYKQKTNSVYEYVELIAGDQLRDFKFWGEARASYARLIVGHNNFEIAETFFNSVYCAVFKHRKIRDEHAFVFSPQADIPEADVSSVYKSYALQGSLPALLEQLLLDYKFSSPYENLQRDIDSIVAVVENYLQPRFDMSGSKI
jgi:isocitrate dehydrogenase kinase/phosphatase